MSADSDPAAPSRPRRGPTLRAWFLVALVAASGYFVVRGPVRAILGKDADFSLVWLETRGFVEGVNPYEAAALAPIWERERPAATRRPHARGDADLLYPPPALVVMSPWAMMPYGLARIAWIVAAVGLFALAVHASRVLAGLPPGTPAGRAFLLLALCFAPVHTNIAVGQTALVPVGLVLGGHLLRVRGRPRLGGLLIGLAAAAKPQVAVPFIVLEAWRRRWGSALVATLVFAGLFGVGAARLAAAGVDWPAALRANVVEFTTANDGDPTAANPVRHEMVDLRPLLHDWIDDRTLVVALAWGITALCAAAFFLPPRREDAEPDRELLAVGAVGVLGLMLVYHRFYDAAILLPLLAWACAAWSRDRGAAAAVLAPCLVFLGPGASLLFVLEQRGLVPDAVASSALWHPVLLRHQAWAVLALALVLAWVRRRPCGTVPG